MPDNAADSHGSGSGQAPESAAHGQYSHTYGPQGQHTESAEPWKNGSASAHHAWLSGGELLYNTKIGVHVVTMLLTYFAAQGFQCVLFSLLS